MKTNIKSTVATLVLAFNATAMMAQYSANSYFTEGNLYRHEINPAFDNEMNYVAMPVFGNVSATMNGNLAVDKVLFARNGKTMTFMNPAISAGEVMDGIGDKNRVNANLKMQILGAGFKAWGGYNTIGINVRANASTNVPGDIFKLAKEGVKNGSYDIKDMKGHGDAYLEFAFGHSHKVSDQLKLGGKLKVLLGAGNVDFLFDRAQITLADNHYVIDASARVESSIKGLTYETKTREPKTKEWIDDKGQKHEEVIEGNKKYVSGAEVEGKGVAGFGLALDFGAEYKLDDTWKFSASILDLGFISWSNTMLAASDSKPIDTDTYLFNIDDDKKNSFENELNEFTESLSRIYQLQDKGDIGGKSTMLGATLNLGAEYTLPSNDNLSFGLLNTTRINGAYSWTDFRGSANWRPTKKFSLSGSLSAGTFGVGLGFLADYHAKGFNVFFGMDHLSTSYAKQGIPLSSNASFNAGLNFPF